MARIILSTYIAAPVQRCFDLSRSVAIHLQSTQHTGERVVAGRTEGLFETGDTVTWEARHLGIVQRLSVRITAMQAPFFFEDEMIKGAFSAMRHRHSFREEGTNTVMEDVFHYTVPFGIIGRAFDALFLKSYMTRLLLKRNEIIKEAAEKGNFKL